MKYKGIIFDFNGVLLWDTHLHEKAWTDFSTTLRGTPFSSEELSSHVHGRPNQYILEYLLHRPITSEEFHRLSGQKESIYQTFCLQNREDFQLSPGAIDLLDFLIKNNIPHTIATASDKNNVDFFVKHLNLRRWFDVEKIVFDNGSFPGKPAPDIYLRAAANINLSPNDCIAVEDSKSGLTAAYSAKIGKVIALGPMELHTTLVNIKGVNEVITSLEQLRKQLFLSS